MSNDVVQSHSGSGCSRASVIAVVIVLLIAACLGGPFILQLREDARRTTSRNRLKQIGLAIHNYHDNFNRFPPGGVFDQNSVGYHGWTSFIAPYLDSSPWYNELDFSIPWDDPRQVTLFRDWHKEQSSHWANPSVNPMYRSDGLVFNHYAGNQTIFYRNSSVDRFRGGVHAGQVLVADAFEHHIPVGVPTAWRDMALGLKTHPEGFGCRSRSITQCLMADGSVRDVADTTDASVTIAMAGPPEHFPSPEQVIRPRDYPLIDMSRIWQIERISHDGQFRKGDRFRRIPPPGYEGQGP